jgi:DNA topoisomerase-3
MTTVIIAEKPSMARAIREGLGAQARQYEITNAVGHLLEQAEPDWYLPDDIPKTAKGKKVWRMEDLPILPGTWKMVPLPKTRDQLQKIGALLKTADTVINAGDPDREGQLLIDEILEYFRFKGKVQRVWLKALDAENVRKAFAALAPNEKYRPVKDAAEARSRSDWVVGMNLSRAVSIKSERQFRSVGRVQTPTLALVVRRDLAIEHFVPRDYFEVFAQCQHPHGTFLAKWEPKTTDGPGFDEEGRLIDRKLAEAMAVKAAGTGKVSRFEAKEQKQSAPLPFSLSALQKAASARFGLSAQQVLDTCQSLYEKKVTTYPRTDCRYLPEEQLADAPKILRSLPIPEALKNLMDPRRKHAAWNNAKITAHNAIIPTGQTAELEGNEARLFDLIWKSYVALFLPEYRYRSLSALVELGGETWKAAGRQDIDPGWKRLYGNADLEEEEGDAEGKAPLPVMQNGDAVRGLGGKAQAKQTKPPARFTDGSLIEAMSNIHKFVEDPAAKAILKETSGLGTEATRAATIEGLIEKEYLEKKGKQLISTNLGRALIAYLEKQGLAEFADPVTTARWEDLLSAVAEGRVPAEKLTAAVVETVKASVSILKQSAAVSAPSGSGKKTAPVLPCPLCKGDATVRRLESKTKKGTYYWACSNRDAHPLLADEKGKPGAPFSSQQKDRGTHDKGPNCPHCPDTATEVRSTSTGKPYYRCPSCKAAFWPGRDDPLKLGTEWENRGASRSSEAGKGRKRA